MASKGGKARAKKMTQEQRSESARKAVQARWDKAKAERPAKKAVKKAGKKKGAEE